MYSLLVKQELLERVYAGGESHVSLVRHEQSLVADECKIVMVLSDLVLLLSGGICSEIENAETDLGGRQLADRK